MEQDNSTAVNTFMAMALWTDACIVKVWDLFFQNSLVSFQIWKLGKKKSK